MKGTNLFGNKRPLNTVEYGYLFRSVESNIVGMQLLSGFAQTAKDQEAKKHFKEGSELAKEMIAEISDILLEHNIQPPSTPGGTVTSATEAAFSDKMMMFSNYLLSGLTMGGGSFSGGFSMRNDLQLKNGVFAKDIFEYQRKGVQLMLSKGWMEEPPQMEL